MIYKGEDLKNMPIDDFTALGTLPHKIHDCNGKELWRDFAILLTENYIPKQLPIYLTTLWRRMQFYYFRRFIHQKY